MPPVTTLRETRMIPLRDICIPDDRIRHFNPAEAEKLAALMEERGQIHAITVVPHFVEGRYTLVAGRHRVGAAEILGWEEIRADIHDMDEVQAGFFEIDENIGRGDLSPLEQGIHFMARQALYEKTHPETRHGGDPKSKAAAKSQQLRLGHGPFPKRFTLEAAEKAGCSERTVQSLISVAKKLDKGTIDLLRGTPAEHKFNTLKLLAQIENEAERRTTAQQFADGKAKTVHAARVVAGFEQPVQDDPQFRAVTAFVKAWETLDAKHRLEAIRELAFDPNAEGAFLKVVADALNKKLG